MTRSDHSTEHVTVNSVVRVLGRFVAESDWQNVTAELRHEAKRSLLNFFGGALGVARTEPIEAAVRVLRQVSGPGQAALIGRTERFDMLSAAFINAISANLLDYDDTHLNTVIHPTAPVAPAALALAEHLGLPGAHVVHAFILGAEVECRIGNAVSPGHYARGCKSPSKIPNRFGGWSGGDCGDHNVERRLQVGRNVPHNYLFGERIFLRAFLTMLQALAVRAVQAAHYCT